MDLELVYTIVNVSVLPAWLLLFVAPHHRITQIVAHSVVMPALLGATYVAFIAMTFSEGAGDFSTLAGVMALFDDEVATLAGWTHYLVFDLFVGAWIVRDAKRREVHRAWASLCLFLALMLGPSGLLLYLGIRGLHSGSAMDLTEA